MRERLKEVKFMKRLCVAFFLCVMVFWAFPAFGEQDAELPAVVQAIVRNRDFFTRRWILWGYEDSFLFDVKRLNDERIGIGLLTPSGFSVKLVYEVKALKVSYENTRIPEKSAREAMRRESISVADAVKLAKSAPGGAKER
jgi:hypothetical protein